MRLNTMRLQNGEGSRDSALQVEVSEGLPARVTWKNRSFRVTSATPTACTQSRWWLNWQSGGIVRRTFRVELQDRHGQMLHAEITRQNEVWTLSKILD